MANYCRIVGPTLFFTISDIDPDEITRTLEHGQAIMGKMALKAGYANLYSMRDCEQCQRMMLYLKLCAIESWDNGDNAQNYFTLKQMRELLSSVEQLFGLCNT